nr:hypothetical protein [Tanacetum cinerariifolium]
SVDLGLCICLRARDFCLVQEEGGEVTAGETETSGMDGTFLKFVIDEDSDDEDFIDEVWSAVILHMVDRHDLMTLYGLVVQYYEHHPATGAGLLFWGDLQVLFDSQLRGKVSGEVLSMFTDVSYPLSVELMKKMLLHKLETDSDFAGNDLTTAEQLIQFIKNEIVADQVSSV